MVFRSVIVDKIRRIESQPSYSSYDDLIQSFGDTVVNQDIISDENNEYGIDKNTLISYLVEYINHEFECDYELRENIQNVMKHKLNNVNEYCAEVLKRYRDDNGYTDKDII